MKKKKDELTPTMKAALAKFSGDDYRLPFGSDVRACEALERRGLLEGSLILAKTELTAKGVQSTYKRGYRKAGGITATASLATKATT